MLIRRSTIDDARGIAEVNVDVWRTTYRGIVPDAYLDALTYEEREAIRRKIFIEREHDGRVATWVAVDDEERIVGFAVGGPERDKTRGYEGELYAIYVRDEYHGRGIGKLLTLELARWLLDREMRSMLVWVLRDNRNKMFYQACGGVEVARKTIEIGGARLEEIAYGWSDLDRLIERLTGPGSTR